jgi:hypothetical protein
MGKNGRILFDRPKPTAGCSASGRRIRRRSMNKNILLYLSTAIGLIAGGSTHLHINNA